MLCRHGYQILQNANNRILDKLSLRFLAKVQTKDFSHSRVEERFKELTIGICEELQIEMLAMECYKDHAHLFLKS